MRKSMLYCNDSRHKKIIFLLDAFLILGLLSYAIIFFIINKTLNQIDISGVYIASEQRLFWRVAAEKICAVCNTIYIIGLILAIYNAHRKNVKLSLKELSFYYVMQIIIMLTCVVPFGILDNTAFFDYIFPVYSLIIITSMLFFISIFSLQFRNKTGVIWHSRHPA